MAEVAGLVLGALGVAGLFKSCIDNFDIVVNARNFSHDFEVLCAELSLHRIRLVYWGQSMGLPDGPFHSALENHDIGTAVQDALYALFTLLADADGLTRRYGLDGKIGDSLPTSKGMVIFRDSFDKFKDRIRQTQKQKSTITVIRWAVHDLAKFEGTVTKVRSLLEALEKTTEAVRHAIPPEARLVAEIESITDHESLSLLQEVGSSKHAPPSLRSISDGASARLTLIASTNAQSFYTAQPGNSQHGDPTTSSNVVTALSASSAMTATLGSIQEMYETEEKVFDQPHSISTVPQHQRWMAELMRTHKTEPRPLGPTTSDGYGNRLAQSAHNKMNNINRRKTQANWPAYRRLYHEIHIIRSLSGKSKLAMHLDTVEHSYDRALASIEGPPGTPYEGGIFWITVRLIDNKPPLLRFHTRIYHPNIDHTGKLCADYEQSWRAEGDETRVAIDGVYFDHYSLGALLFAVCGLLIRPNVEDPLVPEIGAIYITDYDSYCQAARLYTKKFAHAGRPDDQDLIFASETGPEFTEIPRKMKKTNLSNQTIDTADWGELDRLIASQNPAGTPEEDLPGSQIFVDDGILYSLKEFAEVEWRDLSTKYNNLKRLYFECKSQIEEAQMQIDKLAPGNQIAYTRTSQIRRMTGELFTAIRRLSNQWATSLEGTSWFVLRDIITKSLLHGVFDQCFHPYLDVDLSRQLRQMEIEMHSSSGATEIQDVVSWRYLTLEALLDDAMKAPEGPVNRSKFWSLATQNVMKTILNVFPALETESELVPAVSRLVGQAMDIIALMARLSLQHCHIRVLYSERRTKRLDFLPCSCGKCPAGMLESIMCDRSVENADQRTYQDRLILEHYRRFVTDKGSTLVLSMVPAGMLPS